MLLKQPLSFPITLMVVLLLSETQQLLAKMHFLVVNTANTVLFQVYTDLYLRAICTDFLSRSERLPAVHNRW